MIHVTTPKFDPGRVLATPGALHELQAAGRSPMEFLDRHVAGDWGDLSAEDKLGNNTALCDGGRIFSAYIICGIRKIWIITEAVDDHGRRAATTILLPEEY